jgi:hypothetical protein
VSELEQVDWRRDADPEDLREYDAFGPWIEPILSAEDMPRAFRSHYAEHAGARFLLKVPRDEDRADLRPGMDLFAAVVAVHNEAVCVLRLDGGTVRQQMVTWRQIVASAYRTELLEARRGEHPGHRRRERRPQVRVATIRALIECIRFSAWSKTIEAGDSNTSSVTSSSGSPKRL